MEAASSVKPATGEPAASVESSTPMKSPACAVKTSTTSMATTLGEGRPWRAKKQECEDCQRKGKGLLHFSLSDARRTARQEQLRSNIYVGSPTTESYTQAKLQASLGGRTGMARGTCEDHILGMRTDGVQAFCFL